MPKVAKNLSLDADVVRRAERYGARHGLTLSHLVNRFLAALPAEADGVNAVESPPELPAIVRRLWGVAQPEGGYPPDQDPREEYRAYLARKYLGEGEGESDDAAPGGA